jgi:hypothetical protein
MRNWLGGNRDGFVMLKPRTNPFQDFQQASRLYPTMTHETGAAPLAWMDRWFVRGMPFSRFALNVLLFSCVALLLFLALYISLRPGFWQSLVDDPMARSLLLRQVLTNGVPVVFVINYVGFALYAELARPERARGALRAFAIDLPVRVALFFIMHAFIYAGSAQMFGSFGGDPVQALGVVAPTIALSAIFGNLSGAYLYATAISAYPLFIAAAHRLTASSRLLPLGGQRIGMLSLLFVLYFIIFAMAVSGLAGLLVILSAR